MSLVKHQNSKYWYYRFNLNGETYFGSTKSTNRTLAGKIERAKYDEVLRQSETGEKPTITVKDALNEYLQSEEQASEYRNIKRVVTKLLGTKLGGPKHDQTVKVYGFDPDAEFHTLSDADVQKMILARRREGNSNGTILVELVRLSKCITLVKKLGYCVPEIDLKALKKENNVKPTKKRLRYLSQDEEQRLLAALREPTTHSDVAKERAELLDLVICGLDTGARWSEIAQLQWSAVDMDKKTYNLWRNKVSNENNLAMTERMYEVLKARVQNKRDNQVYVFEDSTHTTHRKYTPKGFKNACKRAGIEDVSPHTMRKTFASKLVKAGAPIFGVSRLLGHASVTTTSSYYSHLSPNEASAGAVEILNKLNK